MFLPESGMLFRLPVFITKEKTNLLYKLFRNEIFVFHIAVGEDTNRGDRPWAIRRGWCPQQPLFSNIMKPYEPLLTNFL